jgi:23S rRNA pseudouridine2605 synthase
LNAEQLNSARLARWSQNGEARLTLEAASEWIAEIGFCPYVPMGLTGSAPAPSFVEAVVGRPAQAPSAGERERALGLIARVIENSSVVPLKLSASLGEQPDFVCSPEVLRFVYALRGDRNFKTGPLTVGNEKVTPLSLHCWQAIEQQGPLDVAALQPILGRDITEAAIARALQELWSGMYIFPILRAAGQPAQWELMFRRFPKPVAAGASTGHAEAQSAMISLYLQASVAAREEEILSFLSPLAPQSKLREVIRGLGSMRQLDILDIGGRAHVALQGGLLPEMVAQLSEELFAALPAAVASEGEPEIAMEAEIESEDEIEMDSEVEMKSGIQIEAVPPPSQRSWRSQPLEESDMTPRSTIKKFTPKKFAARPAGSRPSTSGGFAARGSGEDRPPRRPFSGGSRAGAGGFSRPAGAYVPRAGSIAASADGRPGADRPRPSGAGRFGPGGAGAGRSGPPRFGRDRDSGPSRGPFSRDRAERSPKTQERKGYAAKGHGMGERAKRWEKTGEVPDGPPSGKRPFAPKPSGFKPGGSKFRGAKPFGAKAAGSKFGSPKPWQSRSSAGEGREDRPKPWKKFDGAGDSTSEARGGVRKPYASKSAGFKPRGAKPWAAKSGDGEFSPRPRTPREAGDRPKPWQRDRADAGDRPAGRKPYGKASGFKPSGFTRSGFKSAGSRSAEARSAEPESRPEGTKPWVSKGASSRIGSAKSYAARSADKSYAKPGGAKPWAKRTAASGGKEAAPKRRERKEGSGAGPRETSGSKPFWAKNPRGGKGSTAAGRSNRPHGKKAVRKSGKKK